tara:strand:- start:5053 stop:5643 length:591 start_codon:yes stop_codon:yes gene_type:complete
MIRIGIIGDIGSGKSYIAKQFGFPIFNADIEVKRIYKKNRKSFIRLKKIFPKYIFSFPIKKKELSNIIMQNKKNIEKINKIIHPLVRQSLKKFLKKNKKNQAVILDIPLFLEGKLNNKNDVLVFIQSKKKNVIKKLKKRPNFNIKLIKKLRKLQLPLEVKRKKSNYIIKNNFRSLSTKKSVKILKEKILKNERNSS